MAAQVSKKHRGLLRKVIFAREANMLRRIERAVCRRMDAVMVCSPDDANAFRAFHPAGPYVVVPNGVDSAYYRAGSQAPPEPGNLVFTGAMSYFPNEEAAVFFCREIMPLLADCVPLPWIFLVGKDPSAKVWSLHNGSSIIVTGRVDDVRPYVERVLK